MRGRRWARAVVGPWGRLAVLASLLGGLAAAGLAVGPRELVADASRPWAWPVFLLLYALGTVAFLPKPALSAAAGALFGLGHGLLLTTLGTVAGALLGFAAGRLLGREALLPLLRSRPVAGLERRLSERAFGSVLLARLVPAVPFAVVNLGSGVSRMGWAPFAAATALGTVPGNAAWVLAGAWAATPSAAWLWLPAACCGLLLGGAALVRRGRASGGERVFGGGPRRWSGRWPGGSAGRSPMRRGVRRPAVQVGPAAVDASGAEPRRERAA
ncbi:TVP38/TMEM64 family protein [Streptomyces triticirhizae]|uniref:TVP38/TMEM64 family protein n=1 Tax=Streptomyces triticirhizae TaxID=2483353 RepID=UPI0011C41B44|nr:VTT domain-containing protein [Streptomyces triticirhizae]